MTLWVRKQKYNDSEMIVILLHVSGGVRLTVGEFNQLKVKTLL